MIKALVILGKTKRKTERQGRRIPREAGDRKAD